MIIAIALLFGNRDELSVYPGTFFAWAILAYISNKENIIKI